MKLGDSHNGEARKFGRPLDGVRVLAVEQMQALPFATQLMARLGADVVKVEMLPRGDSSRVSRPMMNDEHGREIGAAFLRYNLGKRSVGIDLHTTEGAALVLQLATHCDVLCENLGPGRAERFGVGYATASAVNPRLIYLSISGFGNLDPSPYTRWPAYAAVAEAMSGIYEYSRQPNQPPVINPVGGLGDTGTGMFGLIGVLAALRHRDQTGLGQYVDVSMLDSVVSICDLVANQWSMGQRKEPEKATRGPHILNGFRSCDGWFMVAVLREHQFVRLAEILGHPEWLEDERFATRWGWSEHLEDTFRPAIERWASTRTKVAAATELAEAGIAAAPCTAPEDVATDPHIVAHRMLVEIPRADGVEQPVLVAGNPIKMSRVEEGPESNIPSLGEHTIAVLTELLGFDAAKIDDLRQSGVIATDD